MTDIIELNNHKVQIKKRKGQRHLRLRISTNGTAVLSTPNRFPSYLAKAYLKSKLDWLDKHTFENKLIKHGSKLFTNQMITIKSQAHKRNKVILGGGELIFFLSGREDDPKAQKYMADKIQKLYQEELTKIIDKRLRYFSEKTGLTYSVFQVKNLRSKWGSCDRHKRLSFSLYLIGQEIGLIDYVVMHELVHTKYMNHQPRFWSCVEEYMPDYKQRRATLKDKKMLLI